MGIVLGKTANARESVKFAALLIAIYGSEFRESDRKFLVGVRRRSVNLAVMRAVHRFEHILLPFLRRMDGLERVLAIFCPVSGSNVKLLAANVRGDYLKISLLLELGAQESLELITQSSATGQPQGKAHSYAVAEGKQTHLLAKLAMVALLCFLEQHQVFIEHALLGEGDSVDAGELLTVLVAAPVCSCYCSEFHCLDNLRVAKMRPTAKISESTVGIVCYSAVFQLADEFALILVTFF